MGACPCGSGQAWKCKGCSAAHCSAGKCGKGLPKHNGSKCAKCGANKVAQ
jgi:hypothetical protein